MQTQVKNLIDHDGIEYVILKPTGFYARSNVLKTGRDRGELILVDIRTGYMKRMIPDPQDNLWLVRHRREGLLTIRVRMDDAVAYDKLCAELASGHPLSFLKRKGHEPIWAHECMQNSARVKRSVKEMIHVR